MRVRKPYFKVPVLVDDEQYALFAQIPIAAAINETEHWDTGFAPRPVATNN